MSNVKIKLWEYSVRGIELVTPHSYRGDPTPAMNHKYLKSRMASSLKGSSLASRNLAMVLNRQIPLVIHGHLTE